MARSRSRRLRRIAQQTAELRSSPERRGLEAALGEAGSARDASIDAARATGEGLRAAIKAARPNFAKVYDEAAGQLGANAGLIAGNMPTSGPGAAILAAQQAEHQAAMDANTGARRDTLTDLTQQRVRAREGAAFAVQGAQQQYQQDVGKVLQQLLGLSQEEGRFAAAEFGRLQENAASLDVRNRTQKETARHNRATETQAAANARQKAKEKGKRKWATDTQHGAAADKIDQAKHWAKLLKGAKPDISRDAVAKALADGRSARPVYEEVDDGRGGKKRQAVLNPDGTPKMTSEIPSLGSNVYLEAALDQVFGGHVSRRTTRQLHHRGFLVRKLPVTSYRAWRRQVGGLAGPLDRPGNAPGANGQMRPT